MNTVQTKMFILLNKVSSADVGRQHTFFNEAMRIISRTGLNAHDLAELIANDLGFSGLKFNRATLFSGG